jgi:hypothetical protein
MLNLVVRRETARLLKVNIINPLNAMLNSICHLLALLGVHPILHVSRIKVNDIHFHMVGMKILLPSFASITQKFLSYRNWAYYK